MSYKTFYLVLALLAGLIITVGRLSHNSVCAREFATHQRLSDTLGPEAIDTRIAWALTARKCGDF